MRFVALAVLLLAIFATPVLGKKDNSSPNGQGQGNNQGNSGNSNSDHGSNRQNLLTNAGENENEVEPSASPESKKLNTSRGPAASSSAKETCDPNFPWKNHGEYVSCVAKLHLGGQSVSEAARSDIGRKNKPATSSASPTASGSASPSISPSPEATSSGLVSTFTEDFGSLGKKFKTLGSQFAALLQLLNPFHSLQN